MTLLHYLRPLILVFCSGLAYGWEQCPDKSAEERFSCLSAEELSNLGKLDFELQLAEAARAVGRFDYAAVVLERIVVMHPEQAGARLDLVVLSLRAGDTITAAEHLNYLLSLPDPPPVAKQLIVELDRLLNPGEVSAPGVGPDFRLQFGLGYDDNPNLGIRQQAIDIVIDGIDQTLVSDESITPDSRAFASAGFGAEYAYSTTGRVRGELSGRQYEGVSGEDMLATAVQVDHQLAENTFVQGVLSDYRLRDGVYLTRLGMGGKQVLGDCHCYSVGGGFDLLEGDDRAYRSVRGRLSGEAKKIWGEVVFYGYGSLFYQRQPYAPWGDTVTATAGVDASMALLSGRVALGINRYNSFDSDPYSELFGDDRRDLIRNQLTLGYTFGLPAGYELYLDWSFVDQKSDIPLYDYDRYVGEMGVRFAF